MEFGNLIQNARKQKGLEIRTLAEQVGVDASTISRIENLHTQATVYTAFRICEGLEISLFDLVFALEGRRLRPNAGRLFPLETRFIVSLEEVISAVREFEENREFALSKLVEKINHLNMAFGSFIAGNAYAPGPYSGGEIERYVFSSPFSEEYVLRYPPLEADFVLQIYEQGGVLIASDVERYLKKNRTKGRFLPTSSIEKIKLLEILGLLHKKGDGEDNESIVGMIWEACRLLSRFDYYPQSPSIEDFIESYSYVNSSRKNWKLRLAAFYVTLSRWELLINTNKYWGTRW